MPSFASKIQGLFIEKKSCLKVVFLVEKKVMFSVKTETILKSTYFA
jgi:hypothetical protein